MVTSFAVPQRGDDVEADHITTIETAVNALEQRFETGAGWSTTALPVRWPAAAPITIKSTGSTLTSALVSDNRGRLMDILLTNPTEPWEEGILVNVIVRWLKVATATVTAGGSAYTTVPAVAFAAPEMAGGVTATGVATIAAGAVTAITITNVGSGYEIPPIITITGGGGTGAAATANLEQMAKSGINCFSYTPADTGGDSGSMGAVQTGASIAAGFWRLPHLRPTGYRDYTLTTTAAALEVGTSAAYYAMTAFAGFPGTAVAYGGGINVQMLDTTSKGIVVDHRGTKDGRVAYAVGRVAIGAADTDITWRVTADGATLATNSQTIERSVADAAPAQLVFYRHRAGAAAQANDLPGEIMWKFLNSASVFKDGAKIDMIVTDPVAGTEDTQLILYTMFAGTLAEQFRVMGEGISVGLGGANIKKVLTGTATWDPASVAAGAQSAPTTVTVTGAAVGDPVSVAFSQPLQAMNLIYYVASADTVAVLLENGTAGAINLASGTLRAVVWKM